MSNKLYPLLLSCALALAAPLAAQAHGEPRCLRDARPDISFVEIQSLDLALASSLVVNGPLTVKGKLTMPAEWKPRHGCYMRKRDLPAVVILHGSAGVDARGDFYAQALVEAGIATLEIDMWEARGVTGVENRPALPIITYPDAFAALDFLAKHPDIDAKRIGLLGFSWGAVVTMASATQGTAGLMDTLFRRTNGPRFKAHVANYPLCYVYNSGIPTSEFGTNVYPSNPLTGAKIMIQIGTKDGYDSSLDMLPDDGVEPNDGAQPCFALKSSAYPYLTTEEKDSIEVVAYDGAYHAWDRLMVPIVANDPYAHRYANPTGSEFDIKPDVDQAYQSQRKVVRFFKHNL